MNNINLKLYLKKRKQRLSVFGISVIFDWTFILGLASILLIVGTGYAVFLYVQISNNSLFQVVEDQTPKIEIEQKRIEIQNAVENLNTQSFDESILN